MSSTALPPLSPSEPPRVFGAPTLHTDGDLLAIGLQADGTLWSVEEPGELRGWNVATRQLLDSRPLTELALVWAFNWSARLLASASDEVAVWEVASGNRLASWPTSPWVTSLAFQPGVTVLATGHDDGSVRVWDWAEQRLLFTLEEHDRPVSAMAFSRNEKLLATADENKVIHIWDLEEKKKRGTLEGHKDRIPALVWHPDCRRLFSAGWDTTVRVWDVERLEPIILLNSHATQVLAMALSGDGKLLASADSRNDVHVWDTDRHETIAILRDPTGEVRCLAFTPDDGRGNVRTPILAYGSADRVIHLWDSLQGSGTSGVDPLESRTCVAVSPEGKRLYSLGAGTNVRIWDIVSGKSVLTLEGDPVLRAMALSPDGRWLAGSRSEPDENSENRATLRLYDTGTGRVQAVCEGQGAPITVLAFRHDSKLLASGGVRFSDVWLWSVPTGEPVLLLNEAVDDCSVEALAFHPSGRLLAVAGIDWLATSGQDGQVVLWDLEERQVKQTLYVRVPSQTSGEVRVTGGATALVFRPDGKVLACAGLNRAIRLWDLASDKVQELTGHTETITCLRYSPDGKWLASCSEDRTLRLWDGESGEQVGAWELDNTLKALAFSPNGQWLFTGNGNTSCYQIEVEQILVSDL